MKPSKITKKTKKDTQPSITSFFKNKYNTNKNLIVENKHLTNTEINFNQNNNSNNKLNFDKHLPTISSTNIITKQVSKTASLIGKLKATTVYPITLLESYEVLKNHS